MVWKAQGDEKTRTEGVFMGWGDFTKGHIVNPAHDGLTVGFALAHHEHLTRQRANVDWKQMSPELIRLVFEPKDDMMDSPLAPDTARWFGVGPSSVVSESLELDLDIRHSMFFNGDERSFFIRFTCFITFCRAFLAGRLQVIIAAHSHSRPPMR